MVDDNDDDRFGWKWNERLDLVRVGPTRNILRMGCLVVRFSGWVWCQKWQEQRIKSWQTDHFWKL